MHVRVRTFGKPDTIVVVESKLTKIDQFRKIVKEKFNVNPKLQRLFYGGKLLENGYTFHDYNIKINDVIQLVVHVEPQELKKDIKSAKDKKSTDTKNEDKYTDAVSVLYQIGDLIDVRSQEEGAWFEGKIVRIVFDPTVDTPNNIKENIQETTNDVADKCDSKNNLKDKPPSNVSASGSCKSKEKGIVKYLCKSPKIVKKKSCDDDNQSRTTDVGLWYKVQLDSGENEPNPYCLLKDIRPRARHVIDPKDLKVGQKIMVNHNTEDPFEKGYWYDFKIDKINKLRSVYELVGTLYSGAEVVPQNDTIVRVLDKIYTIDEVVPLAKRSKEYKKMMITQPDKRSQPVNCLTCRDDPNTPCKDCGCCLCSGKDFPDKIVMCDECNGGYHMICLTPPMTELPEEDWYCPSCKRDNTSVIVPGGAKQAKKTNTSKSNRDWGRGMACAGKTKTCAMPANHFGPIPGIEVGMCWRFRIQLSETGVHRPPVSGIHGRDVEGAYSIVLSGGYEDDVDNGNEFTYTGSGGRDLSGNKRTAEQSCDQTLTRENKALARNCAVKEIKEAGGNAGNNWRNGKPVRVVRSYKMMKHFPKYAPKEGIRYDGIYKVVKYYPEKGLSGYIVWKYLLRRDDPNRAPWEPGAKQYPIIYPDGYLEAEAEKKALKEKSRKTPKVTKKRALRKINESTTSEDEPSPPVKKRKIIEKKAGKLESKNSTVTKSPKAKISNMFTKNSPKAKDSKRAQDSTTETSGLLTTEEMNAIKADTLNSKLWDECLIVNEARGKREFIEYITQMFLCIICQEVAATPVTTTCLHNFCLSCIKGAFKTTSKNCPCCRHDLSRYEPEPNEKLTTALRSVLTGYDVGRSKSEW